MKWPSCTAEWQPDVHPCAHREHRLPEVVAHHGAGGAAGDDGGVVEGQGVHRPADLPQRDITLSIRCAGCDMKRS